MEPWPLERAPDYVEPIGAWRIWVVIKTPRGPALRSVFFDQVWEPGSAAAATCRHGRRRLPAPWRRVPTHAAPAVECDCGIYGAASPDELLGYLDRDAPFTLCWAFGRVSLWGTVVECRRGWRASRAYPTRLLVPTVQGEVRRLRRRGDYDGVAQGLEAAYRVPVTLFEGRPRELLAPAAA